MPSPATTRVQNRDIYQTVRLEGTVETYESIPATASKAGHFVPASGIVNRQIVRKGASVGFVRSCSASATSSSTSQGIASANSAAGTAETQCTAILTAVRAPASGVVTGLQEVDVSAGASVASIQPPGFHIRLLVSDASVLFRFTKPPKSGKGEIVGGPSGFKVGYEKRVYDKGNGQVSVYVSLPRDLQAFAGLHAVVVFVTNVKDHVPTLPLSAVRGRAGRGEVVTVDTSGKKKRVTVRIGASDDAFVEVHGIKPSASVLLYPLESEFDA